MFHPFHQWTLFISFSGKFIQELKVKLTSKKYNSKSRKEWCGTV